MKRQIKIMGPKGHTEVEWETEGLTEERLKEIEREWTRLQKEEGMIAADTSVKGEERIVQGETFDPQKDYVMIPRIQGGVGLRPRCPVCRYRSGQRHVDWHMQAQTRKNARKARAGIVLRRLKREKGQEHAA